MKKRTVCLLALLVSALSVLLVGCVTQRTHHDDIESDTVASIEIYDLRNTTYYSAGFDDHLDPVYALEEDQLDAFLTDLAEIEFSDTLILLPVPTDPSFEYDEWVVRINYTDGSYRFISCDAMESILTQTKTEPIMITTALTTMNGIR